MAAFIVRVELHQAGYTDYEALHSAMEAEGFNRIISSDKGEAYWLPAAEYYRIAELSKEQVLQSAQRGANQTGKDHAVVVSEANGVTWSGLARVT